MKTTQRQREDALLESEGYRVLDQCFKCGILESAHTEVHAFDPAVARGFNWFPRKTTLARIVTQAATDLCLPITKP